jgi:predicted dehydrogenase
MRIAIIGCGYVADFYLETLKAHPELTVAGVMDRNQERAEACAKHWGIAKVYVSLDDVLGDPSVELVVNLTNPRSHYAVSKAALLAGKHVYSEKPLAMNFEDACDLVDTAQRNGVRLSCAPCSVLSEVAHTLRRALRAGVIGIPRVAYAEIDDGMMHLGRYRTFRSKSGAPWPYKDEFEVGCTLEHAAYYVTWLISFFGPVRSVSSFASCLVKDKKTDVPLDLVTPDFSVACLQFDGVVARLTCSIVAPHDRSLRIVGDGGVLSTAECWNYEEPVYLARATRLRGWGKRHKLDKLGIPGIARTRLKHAPSGYPKCSISMDFARGIASLAAAVRNGSEPPISESFSLHVNEVVLAIQRGGTHRLISSYVPGRPTASSPAAAGGSIQNSDTRPEAGVLAEINELQ